MRARLALHASQIKYEHREVELKSKPTHMLSLSPKGTVPVLWLPGEDAQQKGVVIDESLEIMDWALRSNDPLGWLPGDLQDTTQAKLLLQNNDELFKSQLDRYKHPVRFGLDQANAIKQRDLALNTLLRLEQLLSQRSFLSGDRFGMVDAAIAPFIRQFARVDVEWFTNQSFKKLISWLNDFEHSQLFLDVMKKVSPRLE